jgi:predicted transcriptional regulator
LQASRFDSKPAFRECLSWRRLREHFVEGKTIKQIARDLGISRNTIRKVLRSGEKSFEYERTVQPRPKLGRWTCNLHELLQGNVAKAALERRR